LSPAGTCDGAIGLGSRFFWRRNNRRLKGEPFRKAVLSVIEKEEDNGKRVSRHMGLCGKRLGDLSLYIQASPIQPGCF
jgi:hypothetical protein